MSWETPDVGKGVLMMANGKVTGCKLLCQSEHYQPGNVQVQIYLRRNMEGLSKMGMTLNSEYGKRDHGKPFLCLYPKRFLMNV